MSRFARFAFVVLATTCLSHEAQAGWGNSRPSKASSFSVSSSNHITNYTARTTSSPSLYSRTTGYSQSTGISRTVTNTTSNISRSYPSKPSGVLTYGNSIPKTTSSTFGTSKSFSSGISQPNPTRPNPTNVTNITNVTKVYTTNYHGYSYTIPGYYHPHYDHYGAWNGFFLGMLVSHAMEPHYYNWAYSHYNDPGYIQWHQDMMMQAQNNADLRVQMQQLDDKVDELRHQNQPVIHQQDDSAVYSEPVTQTIPSQMVATSSVQKTSTSSSALYFLGGILVVLSIVAIILVKIR